MAGYVKLFRSIWTDPDFLALRAESQRLYLLLVSQDNISHVGVLPLTPGRFSILAPDTEPVDIRSSLAELLAARFILIDETSEEIWVRSYVDYDEGHRNPNGRKALRSAHAEVFSRPIRAAIEATLERVGVLATEGAPEGASEGASSGATSPQQPAASSHQPPTREHEPAASSPVADESPDGFNDEPPADVAAAALELLILHKLATSTRTSAGGLRHTLERDLPGEWGDKIAAYLEEHPDASAKELAACVLNVPGLSVHPSERKPDWYADPTCFECSGDGWRNITPDSAPTFAPCDCRQVEPYQVTLASVHPIGRPA